MPLPVSLQAKTASNSDLQNGQLRPCGDHALTRGGNPRIADVAELSGSSLTGFLAWRPSPRLAISSSS